MLIQLTDFSAPTRTHSAAVLVFRLFCKSFRTALLGRASISHMDQGVSIQTALIILFSAMQQGPQLMPMRL
jgi:hypothetical protein